MAISVNIGMQQPQGGGGGYSDIFERTLVSFFWSKILNFNILGFSEK